MVDAQERGTTRLKFGDHALGHRDEVADTCDFEQHGAIDVPFKNLAAERPDHELAA